MSEDLDGLVDELELAAEQLRMGELDQEDAARLVERCATLAGRIGTELDRRARETEEGASGEGQERLL